MPARSQKATAAFETLIGVGLYTVPEASRLTGVSQGRIRRWLLGYKFESSGKTRHSPALWTPQLPKIDGRLGLGFLDLIEVQFIDALRDHSVSWKTIRIAAQRARELFDHDHPFATRRFLFRTDGRKIFADLYREKREKSLLDLSANQFAFERIMGPSLVAAIDFDENQAERWWPLGRHKQVVIDPKRSFGQPIVNEGGVPTVVLADAYRAERSIKRVVAWFDIGKAAVRDAVEYERKLAA